MGSQEVSAFLTHLAVNLKVSAPTQNQALNTIEFLYKQVLRQEVGELEVLRAKRNQRLPVVLAVEEVRALLSTVSTEPTGLLVRLLYGCGLRHRCVARMVLRLPFSCHHCRITAASLAPRGSRHPKASPRM